MLNAAALAELRVGSFPVSLRAIGICCRGRIFLTSTTSPGSSNVASVALRVVAPSPASGR